MNTNPIAWILVTDQLCWNNVSNLYALKYIYKNYQYFKKLNLLINS